MIFRQWQQVLDGTKTQTRRLVKDGDTQIHKAPGYTELPIESVYIGGLLAGRLQWQVGHTYAVQPGRGKKAVGRIRIIDIRRERLQDISHEDIEAEGIPKSLCIYQDDEGYKDFGAEEHRFLFEELWNDIHTKPGTRWTDNLDVWVLTFELA